MPPRRAFAPTAVLLSLLAAVPAPGQSTTAQPAPASRPATKVSAEQVFFACRYRAPTEVPSVTELALQDFCRGARIPVPGAEFTSHDRVWWRGSRIPHPDTVVRYARLAAEQTDQANGWLQGDAISKNQILFATNQRTLTDQHRAILDQAVERMRARIAESPTARFTILGYSDSIGGASPENLRVAEERAQAIRDYLVVRGIDPTRLETEAVPRLLAALNSDSTARLSRAGGIVAAPLSLGVEAELTITARAAPEFAGAGASALLVGVTDVLIEKANEQLQLHVMKEVTTRLCNGEYELLIRQTCTLFPLGDTEGYPPTVRMLRSALRDDLRGLPRSLATDMLRTRIPTDVGADRRDQAVLALFLLEAVASRPSGADPVGALAGFAKWADDLPPHLRIDAGAPAMAHLREFAEFVAETRTAHGQLQAYRRLLFEQDSGQALPADTVYLYTLRALAINDPDSLGVVRNGLTAVERHLYARRQVDVYLQELRGVQDRLRAVPAGTGDPRATRVALYAELLTGVANTVLAPFQFGLDDAVRQRAARIATPVRNLAVGVGTEDYEMALHGLVGMANTLADSVSLVRRWKQCVASQPRPGAATPAGEGGASCGAAPLAVDSLLSGSHLRVLSFAVDVSGAEDADAVRASFRNFIDQTRGYRRKREGRGRYLFANAYVGGILGREHLDQREDDVPGWYGGMHVPVGMELGWPVGRGMSLGPFLQVFDLGAIATRRFDADDQRDLENEAKLSKVFSPGVYLVLGGVFAAPISVGAGFSYAPDARFEGSRGLDAVRRSVFVAVDVPLFP